MDEDAKNIFTIRLTNEGVSHILRFCKLIRWVLVLSILACTPAIIAAVHGIIKVRPDLYKDYPLYRFYYLTYAYFWILYAIVWLAQIIIYWKFSRVISKAIANLNEPDFNGSFGYLYTNAKVVIVAICVSLLNNVLLLLVEFKF